MAKHFLHVILFFLHKRKPEYLISKKIGLQNAAKLILYLHLTFPLVKSKGCSLNVIYIIFDQFIFIIFRFDKIMGKYYKIYLFSRRVRHPKPCLFLKLYM